MKRSIAWLLSVAFALLVVFVGALLLVLGRHPTEEPDSIRDPIVRPALKKAPPRVFKPIPTAPPSTEPVKTAKPVEISPLTPSRRRQPAPPAIPSSIQQETDPQRKAEQMRMHELASARVRVSVLSRRRGLLAQTLAKAREAKSSAARIRLLEKEVSELRGAILEATRRLRKAEGKTP